MDIIKGQDGWLFFGTPAIISTFAHALPPQYENNVAKWLEVYNHRSKLCSDHGSKFKYFIAPEKSCIYPEKLPFQSNFSSDRLVNKLIQATSGEIIYPYDELLNAKKLYDVYYNSDYHWNMLGAITAFNAMAKSMGFDHKINIDRNEITKTIGWGDLCSQLTPPVYDTVKLEIPVNYSADLMWSNELLRAINIQVFENKNQQLPTALCFCDSYFWCFAELLATYFSKLILVRVFSTEAVFFSKLAFNQKFDFIITELVETWILRHVLDADINKESSYDLASYTASKIHSGIDEIKIVGKFVESLDKEHSVYDEDETKRLRQSAEEFINSTREEHVFESLELKSELDRLNLFKKFTDAGDIGAVVMNCNPFTNGHKYLIEYASSQVKTLFLFLLQEDKSFFPFADRFILAVKGTKHLGNVIVIPSGKFIISSATFRDYFNKEINQDIAIDASLDLDVFGKFIGPALGIKKRFVGREPFCQITNQYNEQMKKLLPQHGINVFEIERKTSDNGLAISASYVRKLLKEKNFEGIKSITPPSTYEYLLKFHDIPKFDLSAVQKTTAETSFSNFFAEFHKKLIERDRIDDAAALYDYVKKICDEQEFAAFVDNQATTP
jgi:hypothetical protein